MKNKTVISYACALYFNVNTVHIAGLICTHLKEKKKICWSVITSAHFENLCPFFFKMFSHVVASPAYIRIIFIKCFTVVKHKPDIYGKGFKIRVPATVKRMPFWNIK